MYYKNKFTSSVVETQKFSNEEDLRRFVRKNYDKIDIIQIYTSQGTMVSKDFRTDMYFHIMYKSKLKAERVMI